MRNPKHSLREISSAFSIMVEQMHPNTNPVRVTVYGFVYAAKL